MSPSIPEWQLYERMIARMMVDELSSAYCVTPNARLIGGISNRSRQIDALIDLRHERDRGRRIIVDAKRRKRKIDVTDVEAFRGLMEDVGATHGYLVCPAGYTKAAELRAQAAVSIRLVPLDRLEDFDPLTWPRCQETSCNGGRVFWDGYPELSIPLVAPSPQLRSLVIPFVHYVGKCDRCGRFHVKCLTCEDVLSIPEDGEADYGHRCSCSPPWFWLASIERDDCGNEFGELHVVSTVTGRWITTDRRAFS